MATVPRPRAVLLLLATLAALGAGGCVSLRPVDSVRRGLPDARFVPTTAGNVYVELAGAEGDPPLVLVHGFGGSLYSWRKVSPELAAAGFRVIALDLPGFGYSGRPAERAAYTPEGQARTVAEVLARLGVPAAEPVDLVGHSFGGGVALALAAARPDRVRSLVLVDSTLPTFSRAPHTAWPLYRPVTYLLIRTFGLRRTFVRMALKKAFRDDALVTRDLVDAYRDRLLLRGPAGAYRGLTGPLPRQRLAVDLAKVEPPTLVVWGEDDALIPLRAGRKAAETIPNARLVTLPACGHLPMEECPEALGAAMVEFLGSVGPPAP
jgi:pimeloyl-ACP methyl ester carboxylesterase